MNEVAEMLHSQIAAVTPAVIERVKSDPERLELWMESSALFQALCSRQIEAGTDRSEQEHLMELDRILTDAMK